jgi:hypothetical protein
MQTTTVPVVVYGCDIWVVTLAEHWMRVFKNRVLKKIFGAKREEATGGNKAA